MGRFDGKKVLVTGSGRGFGAVLALGFAKEGADILVHYRSSVKGAEETAEKIRQLGRKTALVKGDISVHADVVNIAETGFRELGSIDILVNNVGDMAVNQKSWRDFDPAEIECTLKVDIMGTMFMTHEVGLRMFEGNGGVIVNIGSQVVIKGSPRAPAYAAGKYGVMGITKSYARALAPKVRVNTMGSAFMETEAIKKRYDWQHGRREEILRETVVGRLAQPEDMVGPVLFLASADAAFVTGQYLLANGGIAMVGA
jgi:3-oxoacyl-[acyl-carrier protein] reductase